MSQENLERLMHEARATSNLVRAATWRALVTAGQIEKLVRPGVRKIHLASAIPVSARQNRRSEHAPLSEMLARFARRSVMRPKKEHTLLCRDHAFGQRVPRIEASGPTHLSCRT
jgi:hypothetical protein